MNTYNKVGILTIILVMILVVLAGCAPYGASVLVEVGPNETAFLIPLTGDTTNQVQLQSVQFLKSHQVAVKRVEIPVVSHQTGRNSTYDIEFKPAAILIKVDRSPVTREWTSKKDTGTSSTNQAFGVETVESIGLYVGATCSALITEEDAATFLYFFAGKPLAEIMDTNVRGFVQAQFFERIGKLYLTDARATKSTIFSTTFEAMTSQFKPMGITITSFGGSEGFVYDSDQVQKSIDDTFVSQQNVLNSYQQATRQAVDNEIMIGKANAFATATVVAGNAQAQVLKAQGEELAKYPSITNYTLAQKSTGQVPTFLIIGGDGATSTLPFGFFMNPPDAIPSPTLTPLPSPTPVPTQAPSLTPEASPTPKK